MATNRDYEIGGIWADGAADAPATPVSGTTYADSTLVEATINVGWPYREIVNSAMLNEVMQRITKAVQGLEINGTLPWGYMTNYIVGSQCIGSDGKLYTCILAHSNQDPISSPTYWQVDLDVEIAARAAADSNHAALQGSDGVHGATSAANGNKIMSRSATGTCKVVAGTDLYDILNGSEFYFFDAGLGSTFVRIPIYHATLGVKTQLTINFGVIPVSGVAGYFPIVFPQAFGAGFITGHVSIEDLASPATRRDYRAPTLVGMDVWCELGKTTRWMAIGI